MDSDWKSALGTLLPDDYVPEPETAPKPAHKPQPRLSVTLDKKRAGKTATIISGFDPDDDRVDKLAATLKRCLATGGSSRGGEILIQGDRVQQVKDILKKEGYIVGK